MKFTLSGPCRIRCCQAFARRWGGCCDFFHISEERGFGLIVLIMGLDRGTCKLVEVQFLDVHAIPYRHKFFFDVRNLSILYVCMISRSILVW